MKDAKVKKETAEETSKNIFGKRLTNTTKFKVIKQKWQILAKHRERDTYACNKVCISI